MLSCEQVPKPFVSSTLRLLFKLSNSDCLLSIEDSHESVHYICYIHSQTACFFVLLSDISLIT